MNNEVVGSYFYIRYSLFDIRYSSDIHQSFHKNGKRIIAKNMTRISSATNNNTVVRGITDEKLNTALDNCISNNSCGMIRGKPSIAMIAAFCCAFAAMAARNVKTRLR